MFRNTVRPNSLIPVQQAGFARATGTLHRKEVPKTRFLNRFEWLGNQMKNDGSQYDWMPEKMVTVDPTPAYHDKPELSPYSAHGHAKRYGAEILLNGNFKTQIALRGMKKEQ